jgi:hypothetical protein
MRTLLSLITRAGAVIWKHTSALVALVLVIAALVVGYRLGRPAPERADAGATAAPAAGGAPRVYTCSMHPSVRLPDPDAKCPICNMDLIPVTDGGGAGNERRLALTEAAARLSDIETAKVARFFPAAERTSPGVSIDCSSTTSACPWRRATTSPRCTARSCWPRSRSFDRHVWP